MTDIAKLVFEIDSTQAQQAEKRLDSLAKASERVEASARKVRTATEMAGVGVGSASTSSDRATRAAMQHAQALANAERVMRGSLHTQSEATAMLLRNAQAQARLAAEQAKAEKATASYALKVDRLRASLDPFAAIQTTLAQRTKLLDDAMRAGAIGADQHAAMLSKVTQAATNGLLGVNKYSAGLKNGGIYATQFSYQLNDIATGLLSGQKPMQVLAQQGGQVFQIFQMAAMEAGGFKAALRALAAEMAPLLATFGLWIAGLAAAGAAVAYLINQHNKQTKAVKDLTDELEKQHKELQSLAPFLFTTGDNANLAAEGQRNFEAWLKKANIPLAEQNRLLRENALADLNAKSIKASENLRTAQEQFDKAKQAGPTLASAGGVGGFSVVAAPVSRDPTANPLYKAAEANLKKAKTDADTIAQLLAKAGQAPDTAFGDANRHGASTPRDMTDERAAQLSKDIATAKAAELQAQMALTRDVEARAAYNRDIIKAESEARQAELAGKIAAVADDKGLSAAKKAELTAGYEALRATEQHVSDLKTQAVDQELASQLLQAELTARQASNAYLDKMAGYAADMATTDAERNAIELASLKRRQDEEAYALAASNALKVSTGEISALAAAEAELRQRNLSFAEAESVLRKQAVDAARREVETRQAQLQSDMDLLQSRQNLARSSYEAAQLQKQINEARFQSDKAGLEAVTLANGYTAEQVRAAKDRLETLKLIHANEQKQIDLSDNMVSAMASAIRAVDDMARAFKSGDIGGGISALSGALKQASGLLGSSSGLGKSLGGVADFLGPIGGVVSAVSGLFGGLFGSSKAKKRARAQEAAQRAAEEAQRQQTIADTEFGLQVALLRAQGEETKATNMEREKEIARLQAISQASADMQKQLYALEDAQKAATAAAEQAAAVEARRASIQDEIDKLTMSSAELLAKTRAKERAEAVALDPTLGDLIDKLYAAQDAATAQAAATQAATAASDAATRAAEQQASVMQGLADTFGGVVSGVMDLTRSLNEFGDTLGRPDFSALSPKQAYAASKAALNDALATGQFDLVQSLGQAFVEASKAVNGGSAAYIQDRAYAQSIAYSAAAANQGRLSGIGSIFSSLRGFATGGSMVIGGNQGIDQNLVSINGEPVAWANYGETMSFTPAGKRVANDNGNADVVAELRAVKSELATANARLDRIDRSTARTDRNIDRVTEGGDAMITTVAS